MALGGENSIALSAELIDSIKLVIFGSRDKARLSAAWSPRFKRFFDFLSVLAFGFVSLFSFLSGACKVLADF